MCFSAEASFVASAVLAATSVATARIPKERNTLPLSLVPAVFAAHQFTEGVLWLEHDGVLPASYQTGALYLYVLIAYAFWPLYVPFASYLLETVRWRRRVILAGQAAGLCAGLACLVGIIRGPVTVAADCCHLSYYFDVPELLTAPYLLAVSIPLLVSSRRGLRFFGLGVTLSCAAAAVLATAPGFPSVWCFFAAVLSGGLYLYFRVEASGRQRTLQTSVTSGTA